VKSSPTTNPIFILKLNHSQAFLVLAIIPLFTGSLSELLPFLSTPPAIRVLLFLGGTLFLLTGEHTSRAPGSILIPLGLFALFGIFSLLWTLDASISLQRALLNSVTVLGLYVYSKKTTTSNQLRVVLFSCFIAFVVVCVGTLPAFYFDTQESYHQGNFRGYFGNSNSLAHYISSAALPLCLFFFVTTKRLKKMIALTGMAILFLILVESRSRAAFAAVFASGAVIYFGLIRFSKLNKSIAIVPVLAIIFFTYFAGFVLQKYDGSDTFLTRSYLWALHINAISERPLLGWGIGVNPVDFKIYTEESYNYLADTEKGSSYYIIPEELGVPLSITIFLSVMQFFRRQVTQAFFQMRRNAQIRSGLLPLSIVIGGLVHGIFESWFFSFGNPMAIIFWLSCIYISSLYRDLIKGTKKNSNPKPNF
jgi:O-antigen ligase